MPEDHPFKERLALLRAARGKLSIVDAADRIGVEQKTWSNWEKPKAKNGTEPSARHITDICTAFGVSADWLLGRAEHESGLNPGTFIVDMELVENPPPAEEGARGWYARVPRRPRVCEYEEKERFAKEIHERRTRAAEGRHDGNR